MTLAQWNTLLSHIGDFSEGLPLILFLLLSKERKRDFSLLGVYFFLGLILKGASFFVAIRGGNSLFIYHILAVVEFGLLFLFFTRRARRKAAVFIIFVSVIFFNLLLSLKPGALSHFNSISWSVNTLVLLCSCLFAFYGLYVKNYRYWEEVKPIFVIMSGFFIYLSGCLFTYILSSQILSKELQDFFSNGWIINSIANLAKDVTVGAGFLLLIRND